MSKLSNLLGKSKTFKIGNIELEFKPLKFENMDLLAKLDDPNTRLEAMKEIIRMTLKEAVPDATDEEIEKLGITHLMEITKAIQEVNGLQDESQTKD
jgi:FKBP-type peptidyl-prolyl cis-trans isomerase (trigger factor)